MKTILRIFRDDIKAISRRFFALAIIVGISFLPALYAWVNIYANGNPYGNTGYIKIALASYDHGITLEDGSQINMAEEVFEELRGSDKIGWEFPGSPEDAVEGVRSGKYYAAIVFEDNFTYNIYHFEQAMLDDRAPITYYENDKANAIAPKITATAASNLQETIKTKYLETVFSIIFDETNNLAEEISDGDTIDIIIGQLEDLRDTLLAYDSAIDTFETQSSNLKSGLEDTSSKLASDRKAARESSDKAAKKLKQSRNSIAALRTVLNARESSIQKRIDALRAVLEKLNSTGLTQEQKEKYRTEALNRANLLKADLEQLLDIFPESSEDSSVQAIRSVLTSMISSTDSVIKSLSDPSDALSIMDTLDRLSSVSLAKSIDSFLDSLDAILDRLGPLSSSISTMLDDIDPVLDSAGDTLDAIDRSLVQMQVIFNATAEDIDEVIDAIENAETDEKLEMLANLLGADPDEYAAFFSSLVNVDVEEVYSIASYGAAMAPFYSVLAIWVGGVILVSILKTHIDRKKYAGVTEAEAFFGRYLLFFCIGQIQAAIIVAGDIFLLGCAPVHPWLMWLSGAVTSFVFTLLIYALTLSFGDIGKAMVVVVMVLQIAGSSGSYPIEILPPIFGKMYVFFPFPHAINAMREALCGMYGHDYVVYLAYLLIFAIAGLSIGLFIRKPFLGMNRFVSEKIEETEVL